MCGQLLNSNISRVKMLQAALQFGVWQLLILNLTTYKLVNCHKFSLYATGCAVSWLVWKHFVTSWQIESWLPDCGSCIKEEFTAKADFQSSDVFGLNFCSKILA